MGFTRKLFRKSLLGVYATRILKGALFLLTILVTISSRDMSNGNTITYIALAFVAMALIDVYCEVIGDQIRSMRAKPVEEITGFLVELLPQFFPGLIGVGIFSLAAAGILSHDTAFSILEAGCIILMVFFCYASQRLSGRKGWRAFWPTMVAAALGVGFVLLRGLISVMPGVTR